MLFPKAPQPLNQESLIQYEDSQPPAETTQPVNQESLIQVPETVAAPVQEISYAAYSDAATEALPSKTLSISAVDDDENEEVTSVQLPIQAPSTDQPQPTAQPPFSEPSRSLARVKVCKIGCQQGMYRDIPPSLETRVASIEATQHSMLNTLSKLSSSIAQLVALLSADVKKGEKVPKDKCSKDKHVSKKKPDDNDDKDGKRAGDGNSEKQVAL